MKDTRIIVFANQKGGVGKTTTVASLGSLMASRGMKVLMVDLDAQCNLTESCIQYAPEKTVFDSFMGEKGDFTVEVRENLHLLPSSLDLSAMDLMISGIIITRYNTTKKLHVSVDAKLRETYGSLVFNARIRENIKLAECPMAFKDIITYAPESNVAKDYAGLCLEIMERINLDTTL